MIDPTKKEFDAAISTLRSFNRKQALLETGGKGGGVDGTPLLIIQQYVAENCLANLTKRGGAPLEAHYGAVKEASSVLSSVAAKIITPQHPLFAFTNVAIHDCLSYFRLIASRGAFLPGGWIVVERHSVEAVRRIKNDIFFLPSDVLRIRAWAGLMQVVKNVQTDPVVAREALLAMSEIVNVDKRGFAEGEQARFAVRFAGLLAHPWDESRKELQNWGLRLLAPGSRERAHYDKLTK